MLTFVAGHPPILGRQPLYFFDKVLDARSRMAPVASAPVKHDGERIGAAEEEAAPSPITARLRAAANPNT